MLRNTDDLAPPSSARASRCPQHPQDRTARSTHCVYSYRRRPGPASRTTTAGTSFRGYRSLHPQRLPLNIARPPSSIAPWVAYPHTAGTQRQNLEAYPCCVQFPTQATGPSSNVAASAFSRASPRLCMFWRSLNFAILNTTFNVVYPSREEQDS